MPQGEKLVVGPINKGLQTNREPFIIDNDSFPNMINAYQWRGRVKRKRGTQLLSRLNRGVIGVTGNSTNPAGLLTATITSPVVQGSVFITIGTSPTAQYFQDNGLAAFQYGRSITGASLTNPCQITSPNHGLSTGNQISINGINGMVQLNGGTYTITYVNANNFTLNGVDSTGYTAYVSGGYWILESPATYVGSINYATGAISIQTSPVLASTGAVIGFSYYPALPVMGIEDFKIEENDPFIGTIAFDTTYAYQFDTSDGSNHDVSYYKNLSTLSVPSGVPAYIHKTVWTPVVWTGHDYQQFWTCNYQGAFWAVNNVPGMQFQKSASATVSSSSATITGVSKATQAVITAVNTFSAGQYVTISGVVGMTELNGHTYRIISASAGSITIDVDSTSFTTYTSGGTATVSGTTVVFTVSSPQMVAGDFVFAYEFKSSFAENASFLNGQTGYVTLVAGSSVTVVFPYAIIPSDTYTSGILQILTNSVTGMGNGIRWYDGDPTVGGTLPPSTSFGWVNFAPPLSSVPFPIDLNPLAQYYLCGAKMVIPFKGRLIFLAPWITTSDGYTVQLQDTIISSQDGTAFYTASWAEVTSGLPNYIPILVPIDQTASPKAYWMDLPGFGFYIAAGVQQPIQTANPEKDVLIIGFTNRFAQYTYTGNDLLPFAFYSINVEWGAGSTFSGITFDRGSLTIGNYGLTITGIDASQRVDLEIPDQIFDINNANNGADRVCSQRDYVNEWVFFTYPSSLDFDGGDTPENTYNFPTQTLFYNYRDQTWALFNESYTTYGAYRESTGYVWNNLPYATWGDWPDDSWDESALSVEAPQVAGGNQQGFVLLRTQGTAEDNSLYIQSIQDQVSPAVLGLFTVPNHCLFTGDYIQIHDCLGTIGSIVNDNIYSVTVQDQNTFSLNPTITFGTSTYLGGGLITRLYVPMVQTKQFPTAWGMSRKTRIGTQQYLLTSNPGGQITAYIYLSQDALDPYNYGPIVPTAQSLNNALVYSSTVFTGPDAAIQTITDESLGNLGDGVNLTIPITIDTLIVPNSVTISVGSVATFIDDGSGGFTVTGTGSAVGSSINYQSGATILAFTVAPNQLESQVSYQSYEENIQAPTAAYQAQIWHRQNTSLIGDTVQVGFTLSDAQMRDTTLTNQFGEIELHGFIFDIYPSQILA